MRRLSTFGLIASVLVLAVGAVVVSVLRQKTDDTSEPREVTPTISVPLPNDFALLAESLRPIVRDAAARCEVNLNDPEPFAELGRIYHGNGESILAKRSYEIALLLGVDDAQTPYYLGLLLQDLGRTDQSSERFSSSIAIDATYAPSHYNLGLALLDTARTEEG